MYELLHGILKYNYFFTCFQATNLFRIISDALTHLTLNDNTKVNTILFATRKLFPASLFKFKKENNSVFKDTACGI